MKTNKQTLLGITLLLIATLAHAKACNVTERTLEGAWQSANDAGFFEQMAFTKEGNRKVFNSWLHERPEISNGSWALRDCVLQISNPSNSDFSFTYHVQQPRKGQLELKELGEPVGKYRRIKE